MAPQGRKCEFRFAHTAQEIARMGKKRRRRAESECTSGLATHSASGKMYAEKLKETHASVQSSPELPALEALAGREWGLHDTQSGECVYLKYLKVRAAILVKDQAFFSEGLRQ